MLPTKMDLRTRTLVARIDALIARVEPLLAAGAAACPAGSTDQHQQKAPPAQTQPPVVAKTPASAASPAPQSSQKPKAKGKKNKRPAAAAADAAAPAVVAAAAPAAAAAGEPKLGGAAPRADGIDHTAAASVVTRLNGVDSEVTDRIQKLAAAAGLTSSRLLRVEKDYYDWSLEERAKAVGAPSIHHMCKTIVVKNNKCTRKDTSVRLNSLYYYVVVQYTAKVNNGMMKETLFQLNEGSVSKKKFNFRWVDDAVALKLSGFGHNAVTPIGSKETLPLFVDQRIIDSGLDFVFLGGGEVDVKWAIDVNQLVSHFDAIVSPLSDPDPEYYPELQ